MTDPMPINLARIEAKSAQAEAKQALANQILSEARFEEEVEQGFNPAAVERQQGRYTRFRPLENRKKAPDADSRRIEEVNKKSEEDLAHDFHKRNPELPADRLARLRQGLRQGSSAEEVLKQVNDAFKDASLADEAMEFLERSTDGDLQETVRQARTIFNEQKGREIIAGRNVDAAAKSFHHKGLGDSPTELRELYRNVTGNPKEHNALFSELSNKYSYDQLQMVVAFLLKGLGYDLKSKGPSIPEAELLRLMTEVRNLQSILWVYLFFKSRMGLIASLFSKYGAAVLKSLTFELLAKEFIKIVEDKYPSVMKLLKHAEQMGLDDLGKIVVLIQYRDAIRGLSPRLYRSIKHRQDLLLVILEALEELEAEEEEEEEKPKKKKKSEPLKKPSKDKRKSS